VAGPTREIVGRAAALPIVAVAASAPLDAPAIASLAGVSDLECRGDRARFRTADPNASIAALVSHLSGRGIAILELHVTRGTLEEVYLELTGGPADGSSDEPVR
jgi:ABC-2 type transport system ATP-binding protein